MISFIISWFNSCIPSDPLLPCKSPEKRNKKEPNRSCSNQSCTSDFLLMGRCIDNISYQIGLGCCDVLQKKLEPTNSTLGFSSSRFLLTNTCILQSNLLGYMNEL